MLKPQHILTILWLGLLPCQLVYADTCPVDSVITYDQNDNPIVRTIYQYDEAGRTTLEESQRLADGVVTSGTKTETTYYANGKVKSTATWKWSTATNNWQGNEKNVYTYNAEGSTLTWEIYNWGTDDWANKSKYEYAYDDKNRQILSVYYTGNGTQWIPKTKSETNYDSKGNKILDRYYSGYDTSTSQWIGSSWQAWEYNSTTAPKSPTLTEQYTWENGNWKGTSRYDFEYDTYGNQTLSRFYNTYDASTQTWSPSSENHYAYFNGDKNMRTLLEQYTWKNGEKTGVAKEEYAYDAGGNLTMTTIYQWDTNTKTFIPISKLQIEYDEWENEIYHEEYAIQDGKWVGIQKEEHTYTDKTYLTEEIIYQWDAEKGDFVGKSWSQYTYDQWKNKNSITQYTWNKEGYWQGIKKEEYTFNAKAQKILSIIYQWDDTNRRWLGSSKSNYEFDAANHLILEEQYTWVLDPSNPAGGYWQGTKKESFGYNAANQQIKHVTYEWGNTINNWIGKDSVLSNYDSNKNQTLNEQYTWTIDASPEGGYWHGTVKEEYTFNKNKQQTSSLIYAWNDANRNWDYVSKTKTEYDAKKNLILDERYEWKNGAWVGTLKKEYAYNAQGQQTMFAYYAWDEAKKVFVGIQKEETELDAEGRTILHATYTWGTNDWVGKSKDTYTYLEGNTQASHTTYKWQSNKWVENKRTEWTYTESGKIATEVVSTWSSNTWVYSTKLENIYTGKTLTAYINYKWVNNAWVNVSKWEQVDANTERSYEWWNNNWSITQEKVKEYDGQNRLVREVNQNYSHGTQTSGSKTEYTYTGDNLTQQSSYTFESDWVETDRITNTFDTENRLTNTTTYTRVNGVLQYVSKTDNEYNGKNITTTSYTWTGTAWQGVEKEEKIYSNDLDYTGTKYEWKNGGWSGVSKTGYTFYPDGKEQAIIVYRWSGTAWVEDTKTEYEYSGTKNIVTAMYQWEKGTWVGQSKVGNYYDEGEDLTTATWTWTNGAWAPNTKLGESHDADGNLTGQTTYSKKGNDFIYNTKTEYEYGATTKDKTTATYKWNTTTNAWQGVSKSGVTYASNGKIASETTYTWISGLTWQPNQKKEYEYGVQAKDLTTAIYQWDATISAWVGVSKSGVTYASNGKIASEFSYVWGGTEWHNVSKTEYEYGDGKNNSVATYKGNGTEWVGVSKISETYTASGDPLSKYTYCWRNNTWADSLKQEYTYDDHGNNILYIDAQWNGSAWANTANSTKWEIEYYDYEKGLTTLDAHYYWKTNKNTWYSTGYKYEYQYDNVGHCVLYVKYKASGTSWVGSNKQIWEYDSHNNVILEESYVWYSNKNKFRGLDKSEKRFDEQNNQVMSASYTWNMTEWKWEGISKIESIINEIGNTEEIIYIWNYSSWNWLPSTKIEYIEDENKMPIAQIKYIYQSNEWKYYTKEEWVYDKTGSQIESRSYDWKYNKWVLYHLTQSVYDDDSNKKLRTDLNASWIDEVVRTYQLITYYYHCDPKFTITVQTANEGEGDVTGSGIYTYYARPQIAAIDTPNCFTFTQWTDGDTNATRRIIVTEDKTFTAEFTPIKHTITATVNDNISGSVSVIINQ